MKPSDCDDNIHQLEPPLIINPRYKCYKCYKCDWKQHIIIKKNPPTTKANDNQTSKDFVHFKSSKIKVSWNGILPKTIPVHTLTTFLVCDDENEAREILEEKLFEIQKLLKFKAFR